MKPYGGSLRQQHRQVMHMCNAAGWVKPGDVLHTVRGWHRVVAIHHDEIQLKPISRWQLFWWRVQLRLGYMVRPAKP